VTTHPPGLRWRTVAEEHRAELLLFLFCLFAYALSSWGMLLQQSKAPHFVWQAEAFLHGQLHLLAAPPDLNDWVLKDDRWYVSFPPFPAVLMMPFVAAFGLAFNDTAFTLVFAALNVALLHLLLRTLSARGELAAARPDADHLWLSLLFGFGTLAWSCGIRGEVWFTAETLGVTLSLCYLLCALSARRPALAGVFWACATLTRTPLLFSGLFFLFEAVFSPRDEEARPADAPKVSLALARARRSDPAHRVLVLRRLALFALPALAVGLPAAWANLVRFGSPSEFGHSLLYANRVNADIARHGLFSFAYLERNLHAAFTRLPTLDLNPLRLGFDGHGMSLLVTTPLFALLLWPCARPRLHRTLWLVVAAIALPGLLYQNDGWFQFGFRFSLDYTPHLFALLSLGGRPLTSSAWALGWVGVAVNAWGAAEFNRFF
jgi:hypothetical protein